MLSDRLLGPLNKNVRVPSVFSISRKIKRLFFMPGAYTVIICIRLLVFEKPNSTSPLKSRFMISLCPVPFEGFPQKNIAPPRPLPEAIATVLLDNKRRKVKRVLTVMYLFFSLIIRFQCIKAIIKISYLDVATSAFWC